MSQPVKLYVYDLSNGMARQFSRQLTGRQIDGIWHTSVVVFGKEIFYGQGINITLPGRSHHGAPLQVIDMGETSIDEETFNEYLEEMKQHYTADKYHLLDFNCNSFTNDCVGFLTGGSIPLYIKDLPSDFLSTPFGASLRPTIDAMYRRPSPSAPTPPIPAATHGTNTQLASSILQAVGSQAQLPQPQRPPTAAVATPATQTLTAPVHVITNPASFASFLASHRAAVAFFTDITCGPCKMIEPVFDGLAEEKGVTGAGFAKIDIGVGMGHALASEWNIRATPTFIFFLDGKKFHEFKGANAPELRTQVDLLLFSAYPPHPHTKLSLPSIEHLSTNPILFTQVPTLDTVLSKLSSFIDNASSSWPPNTHSPVQVKQTLAGTVMPYLKSRFSAPQLSNPLSASPKILIPWAQATSVIATALPLPSLFPLVDMWRLAVLDPAVGTWLASDPTPNPFRDFLAKYKSSLRGPSSSANRNYTLTLLRLFSNAFSSPALVKQSLTSLKAEITELLVHTLLHDDAVVRTAAASLMFNAAAFLQRGRIEAVKGGKSSELPEDEEWDIEIVSAVIEAIRRESGNEEVVYRLVAGLAFLLRLSPAYEKQLIPILSALDAGAELKKKLEKGGCGENGVTRKEVRKLLEEVSEKLCP